MDIKHDTLPPLNPDVFRSIFSGFPSGVTVVTTKDPDGNPVGLTVSAVMSVSLEPPLLAVCLDNNKYTLKCLLDQKSFAVNFLSSEQVPLSGHFAMASADKFDQIDWHEGKITSAPILNGSRASAECHIENVVAAGDHTLIIGRIVDAAAREMDPLTYCSRKYMSLVEHVAA